MLNDEIGTYIIAEAIDINPKLKVVSKPNQLIALINGVKYTANLKVLKKCINTDQLIKTKTLADNIVLQEKTANEVLSDVFGISKNVDYELVYNPEEVWGLSQALATKKEIEKEDTSFKLDTDGDNRHL